MALGVGCQPTLPRPETIYPRHATLFRVWSQPFTKYAELEKVGCGTGRKKESEAQRALSDAGQVCFLLVTTQEAYAHLTEYIACFVCRKNLDSPPRWEPRRPHKYSARDSLFVSRLSSRPSVTWVHVPMTSPHLKCARTIQQVSKFCPESTTFLEFIYQIFI